MDDKKVKKYKSLGQMVKSGDFSALLYTIKDLSEKEQKELFKTNKDQFISELDTLVFFMPDYIYKKDDKGENTKEINEGAFEFMTWALSKGANPNCTIKYGVSCFLKSCSLPTDDLLNFLMTATQNLDKTQKDGRGQDALMYSVMSGSEATFDFLVNQPDFDEKSINKKYIFLNNQTLLHVACSKAKESIIDRLLDRKGDLTSMDNEEFVPYNMVPSIENYAIPDEDKTPENVDKWDTLHDMLYEKTVKQQEIKNKTKVYKTSF